MGFPGGSVVKNLPVDAGNTGDSGSIPLGKIPWRRKWQPTPVFLLGESQGQKSLVGYSPYGGKESHTTEHACTSEDLLHSAGSSTQYPAAACAGKEPK